MNHSISDILMAWYAASKRRLPWRETRDPYLVWLSEVIMQQTRVNQGMDYYLRFEENFPTVFNLAAADETEVLKYWQGLGYYSRARNLHKTAKIIAEKYHGCFPSTAAELIKLPGIGRYTAAAIASIAFDEPAPVVDGNVVRVVSRLFGVMENALSPEGHRQISNIMRELMKGHNPGDFNQSVMEFGALQCTPASPGCLNCPLQVHCFAFASKQVENLPVLPAKPAVSLRYFNYLVIIIPDNKGDFILLNKRTGRDIWHNLYDFPSVENNRTINADELSNSEEVRNLLGEQWILKQVSEPFTHLLTHRKIIASFIRIHVQDVTAAKKDYQIVRASDIGKYPLPRLIDKYLQLYPVDKHF
jgi:A/G-specific adenine glycosylase